MSTVEFDSDEGAAPALDTAAAPRAKGAAPQAAAPTPEARAPGSAVPTQKRAAVYTMMAHQALNAAELLNTGLHKKVIGKRDARHIEVSEPNGPSTGGGKRARQSINLVPISGEGGVLMCGWLDVAQKAAELRSYDEVAEQFKKRFGARFEPTAAEYDSLMKDLEGMLQQLGFSLVEFEDDEDEGAARGKTVRMVAAGVAALVVLTVIMLLR